MDCRSVNGSFRLREGNSCNFEAHPHSEHSLCPASHLALLKLPWTAPWTFAMTFAFSTDTETGTRLKRTKHRLAAG